MAKVQADPDVGGAQPAAPAARISLGGLPNSTVARLARTAEGRRTLARWHLVASGGYGQAAPHGSIGSAFSWQEEDLTVQPRQGGLPGSNLQYRRHTPAAPNLKVSGDNTVAVQDTAGEAKEVYLDAQVIQSSNAMLGGLGSPIELGRAGHTVTVPAYKGTPQNTLEKVRPVKEASQPGANALNADEFPAVVVAICRDAAEQILGKKGGAHLPNIRLTDPTGTRDVAADTSNAMVVTGSQQLAAAVAGRKLSLAQAAAKMAVAKVPTAGKKYGRATRGKKFPQRTALLGINEDAWARAGQAYVIQSVDSKEGRNYNDPLEPKVTGGFGYHFAAVVAESLDGHDAVTLENYRRSGELDTAAKDLLAELERTFAAHLDAAVSAVTTTMTEKDKIGAILAYMETNTAPDFNAAYAKWQQVVAEMGKPASLYFFRMVSQDSDDQSFHRQLARSGYFRSPITFVMVP